MDFQGPLLHPVCLRLKGFKRFSLKISGYDHKYIQLANKNDNMFYSLNL